MLADSGDGLVLPDDPAPGVDERASDHGDPPSAAAIAARPAPVQPAGDAARRGRRARRSRRDGDDGAGDSTIAGSAASVATDRERLLDEPTQLLDIDLLADDLPAPAAAATVPVEAPGAAVDREGDGGPASIDLDLDLADTDGVDTDAVDPDPADPDPADPDPDPEAVDPDPGPEEADTLSGIGIDEGEGLDSAESDPVGPGAGDVWGDWDAVLADASEPVGSSAPTAAGRGGVDADAVVGAADDGAAADDGSEADDDPQRPTEAAGAAPTSSVRPSPDARRTADAAAEAAPAPPDVRLRRITLRSIAFGTVLALLVAAVPALAWVGKERLLDSRGGTVVVGGTDPHEPGYRVHVVPTETGLVLQRDGEGTIVGATLLALGAGDAGGTVLQIPLNTQVREQKYLFDRLSLVAENAPEDVFVREVADLLNVGIPSDNVINIDDESLASLTAPVAPLAIDNPDPVLTDDGDEIMAGPIELGADQIGPYMRASAPGEDELARLARTEMVWSAWLAAVSEVGVDEGVGQGFTDIGPFLRTLAAGEAMVETLDVTLPEETDQVDPPYVPAEGVDQQILDAVPYPTSPGLGRRWELILLNGADGDEDIPRDLMRQLIGQDAALIMLGNAAEMGQADTVIEYGGSHWRDAAERAAFALGGDVEVERMSAVRAEQAGADVVITLGSDVLSQDWGG